MKKLQWISMTSYCHRTKAFSKDDLIIEAVHKEDEINHPYQPIKIPKDMKYYDTLKESTGLLNFFIKSIERNLP